MNEAYKRAMKEVEEESIRKYEELMQAYAKELMYAYAEEVKHMVTNAIVVARLSGKNKLCFVPHCDKDPYCIKEHYGEASITLDDRFFTLDAEVLHDFAYSLIDEGYHVDLDSEMDGYTYDKITVSWEDC